MKGIVDERKNERMIEQRNERQKGRRNERDNRRENKRENERMKRGKTNVNKHITKYYTHQVHWLCLNL